MPTPVHAAARRLRGHLIDTPIIGEVRIPGYSVAPGVRVKAECVQTAASAWYRGYLHYMLASLGRFKGIVLHGDAAMILAQALAGTFHRLPMIAVCAADQDAVAARILELGVDVERLGRGATDGAADGAADATRAAAAQARARRAGFHCLPGAEDPLIVAGIATLGLELAEQLPADVARVVVASEVYAAPVRQGFAAAERPGEVIAAARSGSFPAEWRHAVGRGLRVLADDAGLAALWCERGSRIPTCVVM